jgi:hypothetical protein
MHTFYSVVLIGLDRSAGIVANKFAFSVLSFRAEVPDRFGNRLGLKLWSTPIELDKAYLARVLAKSQRVAVKRGTNTAIFLWKPKKIAITSLDPVISNDDGVTIERSAIRESNAPLVNAYGSSISK